ncbi:MAG: c-type cytochrome [Fimbriiglobus sp.]
MRGVLLGVIWFAMGLSVTAQPIQRSDLKPGLVMTSQGKSRIEPGVAYLATTGADTVTWTGAINIVQPGQYQFQATLVGRAKVMIGEKVVFEAESNDTNSGTIRPAVELEAGIQIFTVQLTRTKPEKLQLALQWRGPGFRMEPVPYFFFGHLPKQRPESHLNDVSTTHGRFLFEEHGCVKCHNSETKFAERTGPNLSKIAERTNAGWLDAWLKDPHALRPNTVMPKMFTDDATGEAERYAMVVYLTSLGNPSKAKEPNKAELSRSIGNGQKLFLTAGCATCHGDQVTTPPKPKKKAEDDEDEKPELKPEDSYYSLGTATPQGLYVLGHVGSKTTAEPLAKFLANPQESNPHGRMPNLNLSGDEARDIARYLARYTDDKLSTKMPPEPAQKPAEGWKAAGAKLFVSKGCVNCHAVDAVKPSLAGPKLDAIREKPTTGCLSDKPDVAKVPVYKLSANQRTALSDFVREAEKPAPLHYQTKAAMKRFNCLNCHNKDGEGGIDETLATKMKALESAENADDVAPPRLTGVGHKVRTSWLRKVLIEGGRARPWMGLRMPQYGEANIGHLLQGLPEIEGIAADDSLGQVPVTQEKIAAGRKLAGKDGMGCISCHDISGITGGGTRGPDLARTHERVRIDWFNRWMHQPQRLAPGTKMPSNFIDGKALLTSVYDGDGDKQIEAMWAYFSLGQGLPLPSGMEPPKGLTVQPADKTLLLRTFMPGNSGTRPITIGTPGGVHMVFDAATCRVSYAWAGNFLDTSPVWNNRGGNPAKLLGPKFWDGPAGFPWAVGNTPPDFAKQFDNPAFGHQLKDDSYAQGPRYVHFTGYSTSPDGTPTFGYELRKPDNSVSLTVKETVSPLPVLTAPGFRRTFALGGTDSEVWLYLDTSTKPITFTTFANDPVPEAKAATAERAIVTVGDRSIAYDLTSAPPGTEWKVIEDKGRYHLTLRKLRPDKTPITVDTYSLARPDDAILKGLRK